MSQYTVTCHNQSNDTAWTFVAMITLLDAGGCQSLAWQVTSVPWSGNGTLSWTTDVEVCLATVTGTPPPTIYQTSQIVSTTGVASWTVGSSGGTTVLQSSTTQPLIPGTIQITNDTSAAVNVGYGQSGAMAVVQPDLPGNAMAVFYPTPSYLLYVSTAVAAGQVIEVEPTSLSAGIFIAPQALAFPQGVTTATATLSESGGVVSVNITYGST